MDELDVYLNGRFVPAAGAAIRLDDAGFVWGATVSERLRTFGGRLFRVDHHLARLERSLEIIGVEPPLSQNDFHGVATEIVARNYPRLPAGSDLDVTILVTPGRMSSLATSGNEKNAPSPAPTVCLHSSPLPFHRWAKKYQTGQQLATTDILQVPSDCWPSELKCRSRMHYYLADQQAQERVPGARALLLDDQGHVRETSTANVLIHLPDEGLLTPSVETVLPGVSLAMTFDLATRLSIPCIERELSVDELLTADEVLLASTPFCLLPVTSLNNQPIAKASPVPSFSDC